MNESLPNTSTEYEKVPRLVTLREGLLNAWFEGKNFAMAAIVGGAVLGSLATIHDRFLKHSLDRTIEVNGKVVSILDCDVPTRKVISADFGEVGYVIGDLITGGKTCVPITDVTIPIKVEEGASFGYARNYELTPESLPNPSFLIEVSNAVNVLKAKNFQIEKISIAPKASPEGDPDENMKLAESRGEYVLSEIIRVNPELKDILKILPGIIGKFETTDISRLVDIAKRNGLTNPDKVIQKYNDGAISLSEADRDFMKVLLDRTTEIQVNGKLDAIVWMRIMNQWVMLICIVLGVCGFLGTIAVAGETLEAGIFSAIGEKRKKK